MNRRSLFHTGKHAYTGALGGIHGGSQAVRQDGRQVMRPWIGIVAQERYASDLAVLDAGNVRVHGIGFQPAPQAMADPCQIAARGFRGAILWIRNDGMTWTTR